MGSSPSEETLHTRIRQQEVVAELGQQALQTDDVDQLMHDATVAVAETLDNDYCKVLELLPGGDEVLLRQGVGWRDGLVGSATVPTDRDSQAGYTLLSEEPVIVDDLRTEERFSGPELLTSHDVVSGISVVIGSVAEPWGVLGTHATDRREFTEHDANFVQSVANVLGSAIDNAETRRQLDEVYSRITDAFFGLDADWTFTYVNDRAAEWIDPEDRGLEGENLWEAFPAIEDSRFETEYRRAMEGQEPTTFEAYYPEPLDRWFEVHAYPSESGLSVYFRDVTERREREQELERYRALTQAANDAIVTIDADSTVLSVNPAVEDVFGYAPGELVGESLATLMSDDLAERHFAALGQYLETGDRTLDWDYVDIPGQRRDGSTVPLAISFSEVEHGGERFFTGIVRDVTERKEYERKLEESNELLEQFAYAASHDLQEPLRMVTSYLQMIDRRYADELDADGREFIEFAVDGADRMRDMIEGLLEYSRVETQGDSFEPVDLDEVVADVREDLQIRLAESDAEVTAEPLPTVRGDPGQLRQVFQNLLDNAVEYRGEDLPQVRISAERNGSEWIVSVRDEGIGIEADDADRIFEVFQRLHSHDEHPGTGIGLALCRRIVERHGGDVWVDSEPGEGTTFSMTLPAAGGRDE